MRHFTLYFQSDAAASGRNAGKKQQNAVEFWGSILYHAKLFSMLWVRAATGIIIRWHCNALQIR